MITKLWAIVGADGVRHYLVKEPLEGIEAWAKGQRVTIDEFHLTRRVYPPQVPTQDKAPKLPEKKA